MPILNDVTVGALGDDNDKKLESFVQQTNEAFRKISNEDRTRIIKSDSGVETLTIGNLKDGGNGILIKDGDSVNRALFGEYPNGSVALKLSQEGIDVTTATDDQLIWSSDFNMFKIKSSGELTVTVPSSYTNTNYTTSVPHGVQSGVPAYLAYIKSMPFESNVYIQPPFSVAGFLNAIAYTTSTDMVFRVTPSSSGSSSSIAGDWVIKYYLLQETAS